MIPEKLLFVDDEPNVLAGLKRQLRGRFNFFSATSAEGALELLRQEGSFAIVVSDMRMPGMNGIDFLKEVRKLSPLSVRLLLTGNVDTETSVRAVNEAGIFRLLVKPCGLPELIQGLIDALNQYRLVTAEKELLEGTLSGSIRLLTEALELVNPLSSGRGAAMASLVKEVAPSLGLESSWDVEVAAMLHDIGSLAIPPAVLERRSAPATCSATERDLLGRIPEIGSRLLAHIPRLQNVSEMIRLQDARMGDSISGAKVLQIMKLVIDHPLFHENRAAALDAIWKSEPALDGELCAKLRAHFVESAATLPEQVVFSCAVSKLRSGMVVLSNVTTLEGFLIVSSGRVLTAPLIERIGNFASVHGVQEPIIVTEQGHPLSLARESFNA